MVVFCRYVLGTKTCFCLGRSSKRRAPFFDNAEFCAEKKSKLGCEAAGKSKVRVPRRESFGRPGTILESYQDVAYASGLELTMKTC